MSRREDLLRLNKAAPKKARPNPFIKQIEQVPSGVPGIPEFLVRKRTPETDERCRRLVEADARRPLAGGIAGLFAAHDERERNGGKL
jgi:hypothetical protein